MVSRRRREFAQRRGRATFGSMPALPHLRASVDDEAEETQAPAAVGSGNSDDPSAVSGFPCFCQHCSRRKTQSERENDHRRGHAYPPRSAVCEVDPQLQVPSGQLDPHALLGWELEYSSKPEFEEAKAAYVTMANDWYAGSLANQLEYLETQQNTGRDITRSREQRPSARTCSPFVSVRSHVLDQPIQEEDEAEKEETDDRGAGK